MGPMRRSLTEGAEILPMAIQMIEEEIIPMQMTSVFWALCLCLLYEYGTH